MATALTLVRPGVLKFLNKVTKMFEVIFFTASKEKYAKEITKLLDRGKYHPYLLSRDDCKFENGMFIKDLSILKRNLKDVIIIDNLPESYLNNPENGLPIESWMGNPKDDVLNKMVTVLERLNEVDDVRSYIPEIIINNRISMHNLFKLIGSPKKSSRFDDIMVSLKGFQKGAAAFLGFSEKDSTAEDSKGTSSEEENNEYKYSNSENKHGVKLSLPYSSKTYSKSDYSDPTPKCDPKVMNIILNCANSIMVTNLIIYNTNILFLL